MRLHHNGVKRFHHPVVGDLTLGREAMPLPADPGLAVTFYCPQPGSPSADAIALLAGWAATNLQDQSTALERPATHHIGE